MFYRLNEFILECMENRRNGSFGCACCLSSYHLVTQQLWMTWTHIGASQDPAFSVHPKSLLLGHPDIHMLESWLCAKPNAHNYYHCPFGTGEIICRPGGWRSMLGDGKVAHNGYHFALGLNSKCWVLTHKILHSCGTRIFLFVYMRS